MTERRPGKERNADRAAPNAGASRQPAADEDSLLGLQQFAGNRAVADLLAGPRAASQEPSAGLRVRDLLRGAGLPAPATVQRVELDEKEQSTWDAKTAYAEKAASAEKDVYAEKEAYAEKAAGQKSWEKDVYAEKAAGHAGTPMLAVGSAGPSVARLQALLVEAGFAVTPDGSFGPRTRAAVVAFQAGQGLAPDGIVGPMTWGALEAPGSTGETSMPGGLVAPGEMELVGPGAAMEKQGSSGPGGAEATLPDESGLKKTEGEAGGAKESW